MSLPATRGTSAEPGTFVEGESQGDNPSPAYQSWHADVVRSRTTGEGSVKAVIAWKLLKSCGKTKAQSASGCSFLANSNLLSRLRYLVKRFTAKAPHNVKETADWLE